MRMVGSCMVTTPRVITYRVVDCSSSGGLLDWCPDVLSAACLLSSRQAFPYPHYGRVTRYFPSANLSQRKLTPSGLTEDCSGRFTQRSFLTQANTRSDEYRLVSWHIAGDECQTRKEQRSTQQQHRIRCARACHGGEQSR